MAAQASSASSGSSRRLLAGARVLAGDNVGVPLNQRCAAARRAVPGAARRLRRCVCRVGEGPRAAPWEIRRLQTRLSQNGKRNVAGSPLF